jgi:hypothetical protein
MLTEMQLKKMDNPPAEGDSIRINLQRRELSAQVSAVRFKDRDTRQVIIYIPSMDISGYGDNIDEAESLLKECLNDFFIYLTTLTQKKMDLELSRLGWKKAKFFNKRFTHPFVDVDGSLQNFNVEPNSVERFSLHAA